VSPGRSWSSRGCWSVVETRASPSRCPMRGSVAEPCDSGGCGDVDFGHGFWTPSSLGGGGVVAVAERSTLRDRLSILR
jgi:hypothetical protein